MKNKKQNKNRTAPESGEIRSSVYLGRRTHWEGDCYIAYPEEECWNGDSFSKGEFKVERKFWHSICREDCHYILSVHGEECGYIDAKKVVSKKSDDGWELKVPATRWEFSVVESKTVLGSRPVTGEKTVTLEDFTEGIVSVVCAGEVEGGLNYLIPRLKGNPENVYGPKEKILQTPAVLYKEGHLSIACAVNHHNWTAFENFLGRSDEYASSNAGRAYVPGEAIEYDVTAFEIGPKNIQVKLKETSRRKVRTYQKIRPGPSDAWGGI